MMHLVQNMQSWTNLLSECVCRTIGTVIWHCHTAAGL